MTLYEKEAVCGGHTLTDDSPGYPVDLGFQVWDSDTPCATHCLLHRHSAAGKPCCLYDRPLQLYLLQTVRLLEATLTVQKCYLLHKCMCRRQGK